MDHHPATPKSLWIYLLRLLSFIILSPLVSPQKDFISIDCGGEGMTPYTETDTKIQWQPDGALVEMGLAATIQDPALLGVGITSKPLTTLRYFPDTKINKFCYELGPVTAGQAYLVRASFLHGNYSGNDELYPSFDLLLEADFWDSIKVSDKSITIQKEAYISPERNNVSICVARTKDSYTPFISSLEIRSLSLDMIVTQNFQPVKNLMFTTSRYNLGATTYTDIRYPDDKYDRIWKAFTNDPKISTSTLVSWAFDDAPPSSVMQTAYDLSGLRSFTFNIDNLVSGRYFLILYFAEINSTVGVNDRVFNISLDGELLTKEPLDIFHYKGSFRVVGYYHKDLKITKSTLVITFNATDNSTIGPIWNAYEMIRFSDTRANITTFSDDVEAVSILKMSLGLSNWTGDPCVPLAYPYSWISCSFKETPRVTSLILPNMSLEGILPQEINLLNALTDINFEGNGLTGNIPYWNSLNKLQRLNLQRNNLSGTIPEFLGDLPDLVELSLQFNNFSGPIPANIEAKVSSFKLKFNIDGNPNLLHTNHNPSPLPLPNPSRTSKKPVAVIAIGVIGAAIILVLVLLLLYRYVCRNPQPIHGNKKYKALGETKGMLLIYEDIKNATQNFTNVIGEGGFGKVYYGMWDKAPVAVKVLSQNSVQGMTEFSNEVEILSKVNHKNLITLVGYCQSPELVLVYEFLSGGSLRDHLNESTLSSLPWKTRLHIALDAAEALQYLHTFCESRIIHGDVKSNNILLDDNLRGKFGDFGLSRIHKDRITDLPTVHLRGTRGYLDPVYSSTLTLNEKSDVYSFGVVLLEIISGRSPFDQRNPEEERCLAQWALIRYNIGVSIEAIIDERVRDDGYDISSVSKVLDIAMQCLKYERQDRPDMGKVVNVLKNALSIQGSDGREMGDMDITLIMDPRLHEVRAR